MGVAWHSVWNFWQAGKRSVSSTTTNGTSGGLYDDPEDDDRTPLELDDDRWDAFLADDDQRDPLPEPEDFWGRLDD